MHRFTPYVAFEGQPISVSYIGEKLIVLDQKGKKLKQDKFAAIDQIVAQYEAAANQARTDKIQQDISAAQALLGSLATYLNIEAQVAPIQLVSLSLYGGLIKGTIIDEGLAKAVAAIVK